MIGLLVNLGGQIARDLVSSVFYSSCIYMYIRGPFLVTIKHFYRIMILLCCR